ncbi:hypothetical protein AMATHDRAFT_59519 [Amanita thiersii Skay4041]|uniref:Peptidase S28 n=1 Tax=Amanita thiersii Skay4041 TaxID=703135 RepID=A0A2A9NSD9_9AGAR|nr:hypothetical protein AMATHDRAFT_59519 [Amanita thiersii Skay4041]
MLTPTWLLLSGALVWISNAQAAATTPPPNSRILNLLGAQGVNLWKLGKLRNKHNNNAIHNNNNNNAFQIQDGGASLLQPEVEPFEEQWFEQPLDHFSKPWSKHKWQQRYWVNTRHYKPGGGGPVIVLDGGETSGEDRLPFLNTGIVEILAKATGGVGVVLEHRYYGNSLPVSNFSTDALRWLTNEQSAADSANFMAKVKFDGIEEDLTAPGTPWIYYGGSYAGARAAHMRVLYPELVYGAIASSAVTHAALENWQYMEIIRNAADPKCSQRLESAIKTIDGLLAFPPSAGLIKRVFGLPDLENDDFAALLTSPLGYWQAKNWDPEVGSTGFDDFCEVLNGPVKFSHLANLPYEHSERMVEMPEGLLLDLAVVKYAYYIKKNVVSECPSEFSHEDCFGTTNDAKFQDINIDQDWRLWMFQVCTQWGYFSTAPPKTQPRIVSQLLTLEFQSKICRQAFPPGDHCIVPGLPNITAINALGDFSIAADRLAIIDGEVDPWRPMTPHSTYADDRQDTILRPFKLIPNGVHHYDEYGLRNMAQEPPEIRQIHEEMIHFVREWLKDWKAPEKSENHDRDSSVKTA